VISTDSGVSNKMAIDKKNERFGPASSRDRTAAWQPADKAPPIRVSGQPGPVASL